MAEDLTEGASARRTREAESDGSAAARASWGDRARGAVATIAILARSGHRIARDALARIDPNDDPDADPLTPLQLAVLLVAVVVAAGLYLRFKYQPMQDFGHHVALAAVVADYGRPGSLYTSLYEPIDPIAANSLLYQLAGRVGRLVGVTNAVRGCMVLYVAGVPLASVYALRVFGRSAWAALVAVPLTFDNMNYVAGFANLLFAAPLMVLTVPALYLAIDAPSVRRTVAAAALFALLFLAHAHLFLWTGVLCFAMTLALFARALARGPSWRDRAAGAARVAAIAAASVLPALAFFARWYARTFGEGRTEGGIMNATGGWSDHFGAYFRSTAELVSGLGFPFDVVKDDSDLKGVILLAALVAVAVALARLHRFRKPPVLELACAATFLSYFVLPDGLKGHDIVTQRQPGIAMWLLPALVSPVPAARSRAVRVVTVAAIALWTGWALRTWRAHLIPFEHDEAAGLAWVMKAAPPRQRLHYVKLDPDSAVFTWRPWWHIEKIYMGDGLGQTADTPGILSTSAIRYRSGVDIHRIGRHTPDWPSDAEIWRNFDLVLVRRWHPTTQQRAEAEQHGELLRKSGDWELWRSKEATPITP